jgi:hypothetical protein
MKTYPIFNFAFGESFEDVENGIEHWWRVYVIHAFLANRKSILPKK